MTDLASAASRGAASTIVWQLLRALIQFGSALVLARLLSPSDFGLLAMILAVTGLGEVLRDLGLSLASVQAKSLDQCEKSNLFWINVVSGAVLSGIVCVLARPMAALYGEPALVTMTLALAPIYLLNATAAQFRAQLNRDMRYTSMNLVDVIPYAIGFGIAAIVGLATGSYWALVIQQLTVALSGLVLAMLVSRWWPSWPKRHVSVRRFLRFGIGATGTQTLQYITRNADNVAIGAVWGSAMLGLYAKAFQLLILPMNQFMAPMTRVTLPVLSKVRDDRVTFLRYFNAGQMISGLVVAVGYGIVTGLAHPLIRLFLGADWLPMASIFQALAVGGLFRALTQPLSWVYLSLGRTTAFFKYSLVSQPLIILCMLTALPWGPVGVAVALSVASAANWVMNLVWCQKQTAVAMRYSLDLGIRILFVYWVPITAMTLVVVWLTHGSYWSIVLGIATSAAYLGLAYVLFSVVKCDLQGVLRALKRLRNS